MVVVVSLCRDVRSRLGRRGSNREEAASTRDLARIPRELNAANTHRPHVTLLQDFETDSETSSGLAKLKFTRFVSEPLVP